MTTVGCWLVVEKNGNRFKIVKSAHRPPSLTGNQARIKVKLEFDEAIFDAPVVAVPVEATKIGVAVDEPQ